MCRRWSRATPFTCSDEGGQGDLRESPGSRGRRAGQHKGRPANSMHCRKYLREDSRVRIDKTLTGNISVLIQEGSGKPLAEGARLAGSPTRTSASSRESQRRASRSRQAGGDDFLDGEGNRGRGDLTGAVSDIATLVRKSEARSSLADQLRRRSTRWTRC